MSLLYQLFLLTEHLKTTLEQEIKTMLIELPTYVNATINHWSFNIYLIFPLLTFCDYMTLSFDVFSTRFLFC